MKYAIIENNEVINIINAEQSFIDENRLNAVSIEGIFVDIGWKYIDGEFIKVDPPQIVPEKVTPRQIRLALLGANLLDQIESALEIPSNKAAKISWEYSIEINRDDALLNAFAASLGFTSEQLDQLFITAGSL